MKKILSLLIITFIVLSFLLPIFCFESCAEKEMEETVETIKAQELSNEELMFIHINKEISDIEHLKEVNKLEWYKAYKEILCKYKYKVGTSNNIFDFYTEDEVRLICRVVETECYGQDFDSKCNVASVIFNRIDNGKFGSTLEEVITRKKQFAYWRKNITEDTLYSVLYSFEIEDTTGGCLYFHSNTKTDKFNGCDYVFTDSAGHHFYKMKGENI